MLYPAMADLLKHIDSRYLLVNVIARRARQMTLPASFAFFRRTVPATAA